MIAFHRDFLVPSGSGLGFRALSPFFFVSFLRNGATNEFLSWKHGLLLFGVYTGVIGLYFNFNTLTSDFNMFSPSVHSGPGKTSWAEEDVEP